MLCRQKLEEYFRQNNVPFRSATHQPTFSAPQMASALHTPGRQVAKVVVVRADERWVMLVMPANSRVDFQRLATALPATEPRLARESELEALFPDCEVGAMPPFGNLYGMPVYLDEALMDDPELVFQAGTYIDSMRIRCVDYVRMVKPEVLRLIL